MIDQRRNFSGLSFVDGSGGCKVKDGTCLAGNCRYFTFQCHGRGERTVIPLMESMIGQIEEQQTLMAEMILEMQMCIRDRIRTVVLNKNQCDSFQLTACCLASTNLEVSSTMPVIFMLSASTWQLQQTIWTPSLEMCIRDRYQQPALEWSGSERCTGVVRTFRCQYHNEYLRSLNKKS